MSNLLSVIRFTLLSRLRSKSFRITTIVFIIILSILINLPATIDKLSSHEPAKIGMLSTNSDIANTLSSFYANQEQPDMQIVILPDAGSAAANDNMVKEKIKSKEIKGFLEVSDQLVGGFPKMIYKSSNPLDLGRKSNLQAALSVIKAQTVLQNISPEQIALIQTPVSIDSEQINTSEQASTKSESQMVLAYAMVYALLMMLYISAVGFGNIVAMEITTEKSSRVMEILITSVSPLKQMFGKIIGVCILGIIQIVILAAAVAVNLRIPSNQHYIESMHLNLSDLPLYLLGYFIIFYLGGFFTYATIFAAVGSLVSRTEEVGQAIMPVTFLIVAGFMIAMIGLQMPNSGFIVAMSFVPFFTPLIMFLRLGLGSPELWEVWLSIAEMIVMVFLLGWLAAKIYRTGVLMYGKRPSFKELRKAMKSYSK